VTAAWILADWCGRTFDGSVNVTVDGFGHEATTASTRLGSWCPFGPGEPKLVRYPS
jgi:hypothetical protein